MLGFLHTSVVLTAGAWRHPASLAEAELTGWASAGHAASGLLCCLYFITSFILLGSLFMLITNPRKHKQPLLLVLFCLRSTFINRK